MQIVIPEILSRLAGGSCLWVGDHPPRSDMVVGTALVDPNQDFRLSASLHQAFDLVFLAEQDLGEIKQWPLVLDEGLRAAKPGGIILVRVVESGLLSIFQLANSIEKWTDGHCVLIDQVSDNGRFLMAFQLTHDAPRTAATDDFTFALVTDGRKPASVSAFVDSVLALPPSPVRGPHEILICGPVGVLADLGDRASWVRLIAQPEAFADRGWITRKKNLLVDASTRENILIAHDRYVIPPDFLSKIEAIGGDFDVIVPRQTSTEGHPLPDTVALSDHLNWSTPAWLEFGDYHPFGYVNGGVIIAKTERLKRTRWSELLFWGQAEDVDLSRRLQDAGVIPRPLRDVVVTSEQPRTGFVEGFERLPSIPGYYPRLSRPPLAYSEQTGPLALALKVTPLVRLGEPVTLGGGLGIAHAAAAGFVLGAGWVHAGSSVAWNGPGPAAISLRFQGAVNDLVMTLTFRDATSAGRVTCVRINSIDEVPIETQDAVVSVAIPSTAITDSNVVHLWLAIAGAPPIALTAIALHGVPAPASRAPRRPL